MYKRPLGNIITKINLSYHLYADDSRLYMSFKQCTAQHPETISTIEDCINEIRIWTKSSMLKLNDAKTEIIVFGTSVTAG